MYIYSEMPKWLANLEKKSVSCCGIMKYFLGFLDEKKGTLINIRIPFLKRERKERGRN